MKTVETQIRLIRVYTVCHAASFRHTTAFVMLHLLDILLHDISDVPVFLILYGNVKCQSSSWNSTLFQWKPKDTLPYLNITCGTRGSRR